MRASRAACVILFGSVALWVGGCQDGGPAEAPDTAPLALDDPNLYYVLAHGGTCYVGRVRAVLVDDAGFLEGKGWPYERGTLRLAVEEALQGPAAKEVGVPFYWTEDPKGRPATLLADWGPPDASVSPTLTARAGPRAPGSRVRPWAGHLARSPKSPRCANRDHDRATG